MAPTVRRALSVVLLGALVNGCGTDGGVTGPVPVASVVVTPDPATVTVGATLQLSVVAQDQSGTQITGRDVTWTSMDATIATVTGGTVAGVREGTTEVSAVVDGKAGTVSVTVGPAAAASVDVRPTGVEILMGETLQLTATPLSSGGTPLPGRAVTWSSSDEATATVDATGLVSGVAGGLVAILATVDQATGEADIEVVDPTAPRISVVTPFPIQEGASATLVGMNFGATIGENAVTVDGVAATVTAADPTSVTFTVPPTGCGPHREVVVSVTAGGKTGFESHPLRPTPTTVGIGEQVVLTGPDAPCLRFDATQSFESYLIGVQSTSENESDLVDVVMTAQVGVEAGGPSGGLAAATPARSPVFAAPSGGPLAGPVGDLLGRRSSRHAEARRRQLDVIAGGGFDFGPAAAGALQSVIPSNASVGDQFPVRVPGHFPGGCSQFAQVTAEVRVVTPRGFWLVDLTDLAAGSFSDAQLQQIADSFEDDVAPTLEAMFGAIPDSDGDPRIAFVVTNAVNAEGWLSYPSLFDYLPVAQCAASNEGDWMYVATPVAGDPNFSASALLSVMGASFAHDFTHVIQNRAQIAGGATARVPAWIEEGQANLGSEIYSHFATSRSARQNYNSSVAFEGTSYNMVGSLGVFYGFAGQTEPKVVGAPEQCAWVRPIPGGTPAGPCDGGGAGAVAWAFLRWLTDHYGASVGGEAVFHQALIDGTGTGFERIEAEIGLPIESLLAPFAATLYVDDRINVVDPLLGFPSWDLFDIDQNVFQQARLAPTAQSFQAFTQGASVRGGSTAYFTVSAAGRPATALEVTGPSGGTLSPDVQVWAVRLQ